MATVMENPSLFITLTILFLLLGTAIGYVINLGLSKRRGSQLHVGNRAFASGSELKSHLYSLEFEKSLTTQALTRVSEAMNRGKISPPDYDRLALQYNEKLRNYEKDIAELRSTSDLFELQNLRNDLNYFLQNKMKQLDEKLSQLYKSETQLRSSPTLEKFVARGNIESTGQTSEPSHLFSRRTQTFIDQEKKIQDTQKEIMVALERLGGEESDKKQGVRTLDNKNKDALAGFEIG